jgi:hypothetical protein
MSIADVPEKEPPHRVRISRRTGFVLGLLVVLIVYPFMLGVVPWAIAFLTPRYGWTENGPSIWNLLGLIPVVIGIAGLI